MEGRKRELDKDQEGSSSGAKPRILPPLEDRFPGGIYENIASFDLNPLLPEGSPDLPPLPDEYQPQYEDTYIYGQQYGLQSHQNLIPEYPAPTEYGSSIGVGGQYQPQPHYYPQQIDPIIDPHQYQANLIKSFDFPSQTGSGSYFWAGGQYQPPPPPPPPPQYGSQQDLLQYDPNQDSGNPYQGYRNPSQAAPDFSSEVDRLYEPSNSLDGLSGQDWFHNYYGPSNTDQGEGSGLNFGGGSSSHTDADWWRHPYN